MLELINISHCYEDQRILREVSLKLAPGQRLAIMGPSGQGKTTLLRIALGLVQPLEGRVENTFSKTAVVFQEPRLLPWCTALENVNLVLGGKKRTLKKAEAYLLKTQLSDAADKYPEELSGGMQQRVALARALAMEGELLILDEPFKAMDEALRQEMIALVDRTEAAILLVTHEAKEAAALGCRILNL